MVQDLGPMLYGLTKLVIAFVAISVVVVSFGVLCFWLGRRSKKADDNASEDSATRFPRRW